MKAWITVYKHKVHEIKILNGAEIGDCMDYKVEPALPGHETFPTVGDAVVAIEAASV